MTSRLLLLVVALALILGNGCVAERQSLSSAEIERLAWYVEDVAHGNPRQPAELELIDGSTTMAVLAGWARGAVQDGQTIAHPFPLQARRQRWPLLAAGLGAGLLTSDEEGLLHLATSDLENRELYHEAVRQENLDRIGGAAILLRRADLAVGSATGQRLVTTLIRARIELDRAAGGSP